MTNEQALAIILGIVMPAVVSFLKSCDWSTKWRFWFTIVCCAIAGAITAAAGGSITLTYVDPSKLLVDIGIIFAASQVVYKAWFEGTAIDKRLTGE